jgi:hypothetical protein
MTLHAPISHHFVPVFYLAAWESEHRVTRYYRPHYVVVASRIAPKNTGFEDHLYSLQGVAPEQQQWLETYFFAPVDSKAAIAHHLMLEGKLNALTNDQRVDWARFMMSMQLRSPFALAEVQRLADQNIRSNLDVLGDAEYAAIRKAGDPETLYGWTAKYQPLVLEEAHKRMLPGLIDHEGVGQHLINMHWAVIDVGAAKHTLLTGDRSFINTHGLKNPLTAVVFPLSPERLFVATNGMAQTAQLLSTPPAKLVPWANNHIVGCAVDFVIGVDDGQLRFVERRLRRPDAQPLPGPIGKCRPNCPD